MGDCVCVVGVLQVLSDWDRFARGEYLRLAVEEEPDDMQVRPTARVFDRCAGWFIKHVVAVTFGSSTQRQLFSRNRGSQVA